MLDKYIKDEFLSGEKLVGDDFSRDEIHQWYKEEEEAYCELTNNIKSEPYLYENINNFYGLKKILSKLKHKKEINILCFGAAYGGEVKAIKTILDKDTSLKYQITVIDSSDEMLSSIQQELSVKIKKATADGIIDIEPNSFDLVTCFGVLHHIPNVSFVLSQLSNILKSKGFIFLREPISSMGKWQGYRVGTTINERGISEKYFINTFDKLNLKIVSKNYSFFIPIIRLFNIFGLNINSYIVIYSDYFFSKLFSWNVAYYRSNILKKLAPGSLFIVGQKK
jgi:2-polyprenyl-3-methyl-5-hydroxy-6-metoxy-1,4-benzoquinol methylase